MVVAQTLLVLILGFLASPEAEEEVLIIDASPICQVRANFSMFLGDTPGDGWTMLSMDGSLSQHHPRKGNKTINLWRYSKTNEPRAINRFFYGHWAQNSNGELEYKVRNIEGTFERTLDWEPISLGSGSILVGSQVVVARGTRVPRFEFPRAPLVSRDHWTDLGLIWALDDPDIGWFLYRADSGQPVAGPFAGVHNQRGRSVATVYTDEGEWGVLSTSLKWRVSLTSMEESGWIKSGGEIVAFHEGPDWTMQLLIGDQTVSLPNAQRVDITASEKVIYRDANEHWFVFDVEQHTHRRVDWGLYTGFEDGLFALQERGSSDMLTVIDQDLMPIGQIPRPDGYIGIDAGGRVIGAFGNEVRMYDLEGKLIWRGNGTAPDTN